MYEKKVLPNGVRVLCERLEHVRSAAIGIWIGNGSRYESSAQSGISHFIEHMLFKGTQTRTAKQIAIAMDAIGGQVNAFTTKEYTCYYFKTLDSHLIAGVDILADMFLHPKFDSKDIDLERGVVLEEIDMYEDSPEDVAIEKLSETCFADSALGRPILGYKETLQQMDGQALHDFVAHHYHPQDTVIALSGSISDDALQYICDLFSTMTGNGHNTIVPAQYARCVIARPKEIEQCHLCLGFPALPIGHENRYTLQMLSAILGDGMSSRLFQTVREENGLCYSIYSFNASYLDVGLFNIYAAFGKPTESRAIELILQVLQDFCQNAPTQEELDRCREQRKTGILLGLESTMAHMNHLGRNELCYDHIPTVDEILSGYDAVTTDQVLSLARTMLNPAQLSLSIAGQVSSADFYQDLLHRSLPQSI